jgi:hypothetical protein
VDEAPIERWLRLGPAAPAGSGPAAVEGENPGVSAGDKPLEDRPGELGDGPGGGLAFDRELDREAFGADRSALIVRLVERFGGKPAETGGFALARPGTKAAYFGPCVSRSVREVRTLLGGFLRDRAGEPAFWDVLPENGAAVALAEEHGFAPVRRLSRMARVAPWLRSLDSSNDGLVFAIAGFEFG